MHVYVCVGLCACLHCKVGLQIDSGPLPSCNPNILILYREKSASLSGSAEVKKTSDRQAGEHKGEPMRKLRLSRPLALLPGEPSLLATPEWSRM